MISGFFALRRSVAASRIESRVGPRAAECGARVGSKKASGIVEGLGLDVLGERR